MLAPAGLLGRLLPHPTPLSYPVLFLTLAPNPSWQCWGSAPLSHWV